MASALPIGSVALCIDVDADSETRPLYRYRQASVYPGLQQNVSLLRAHGAAATRSNVAALAAGANLRYLTGSGHGTADAFNDGFNRPIFRVGEYDPREVSGRIVHLLTCESAQTLGPDFVSNGCLAFFGYAVEFVYSPYPDLADLFFDADAEIDRALIAGRTAAEALAAAVTRFQVHTDWLEAQARRETDAYRKEVLLWTAMALEFNRDNLRGPTANDPTWGRPDVSL